MPTILYDPPYRFFFYSKDGSEPPHVHVARDACECKFWLTPVRFERNRGFRSEELRQIEKRIHEHFDKLIEGWNEYFDDIDS